jgi:hypothetical protein
MRNTTWMLMMALAMTIGAVGCGSDDNDNSPVAPPVDTAPPALPSGLAVTYDPATLDVVVTWDPNTTDADFVGFLVSRTAAGATERLVYEPLNETAFTDNALGVGRTLTYRVFSVDETGNVSAAATVDVQIEVPTPRHQLDQQ